MLPEIGVGSELIRYCLALAPAVCLGAKSYVEPRFSDLQWIALALLGPESLDVVNYRAIPLPPLFDRRVEKEVGVNRMKLSNRK